MLQDEIENAARLVKTDAYQMSIGEIVNNNSKELGYFEQRLLIQDTYRKIAKGQRHPCEIGEV